ncbi:MAG: hypothetical protein J7K39_07540 [Bacteroidales bacterium]|nr:hypothetical protein [Bacteroidales bacterium]
MEIKKNLGLIFIFTLFLSLTGSFSSCKSLHLDHASRMEKKAIRSAERSKRKANRKFTKQYDKKYKHQTKIQNEQQRNMIKQSRKKPKNMGKRRRSFFLFRWLGI